MGLRTCPTWSNSSSGPNTPPRLWFLSLFRCCVAAMDAVHVKLVCSSVTHRFRFLHQAHAACAAHSVHVLYKPEQFAKKFARPLGLAPRGPTAAAWASDEKTVVPRSIVTRLLMFWYDAPCVVVATPTTARSTAAATQDFIVSLDSAMFSFDLTHKHGRIAPLHDCVGHGSRSTSRKSKKGEAVGNPQGVTSK